MNTNNYFFLFPELRSVLEQMSVLIILKDLVFWEHK